MRALVTRLSPADGRFSIMPLGDVHYPHHEKGQLLDWVKRAKKTDARVFLMGDMFNLARTHYRTHIRSYTADTSSQRDLDALVNQQVNELAAILKPIAAQIDAVISGNHEWLFANGINSEQLLAQALDAPYLGTFGVVRHEVSFKGRRYKIDSMLHHTAGQKGGGSLAGDARALQRLAGEHDFDLFFSGHTHRAYAVPLSKMGLARTDTGVVLLEHEVLLVRTGSLARSYNEDETNANTPHLPSYVEQGAMAPANLRTLTVHVTCERSRKRDLRGVQVVKFGWSA